MGVELLNPAVRGGDAWPNALQSGCDEVVSLCETVGSARRLHDGTSEDVHLVDHVSGAGLHIKSQLKAQPDNHPNMERRAEHPTVLTAALHNS
jgi:hypothetical protein